MKLKRRQFLKGCVSGTVLSLALPPLELFGNLAHAQTSRPDPFFGLFFWANGLPWHARHGAQQAAGNHPDLWTPNETGPNFNGTPLLQPIMGHRPTVISGLEPYTEIPSSPPGQGDGHMRGFMVAMTGDRPRPEGFNHSAHSLTALRGTLDQYVARHPEFYRDTPFFRSIEAGVSTARFHGYGHWNAISYNGPDSINLPIMAPSALYQRLFGVRPDNTAAIKETQMLDAVIADARRLQMRLGARDRQRLEFHLEGIYSLQNRLNASTIECEAPPTPSDQGDLIEKSRIMGELLGVAVQCGLTRTFSMMLTSPATTHLFNNLGVPDGMHKTCHDGHWGRVRDITEYQMQALSAFLTAFDRDEGDGSRLLDRGLVYATSEYGEGWKHGVKELPVVLFGGAGGRLARGMHVREVDGNLARAQLTALNALGLSDDRFGFNGAETDAPFTELLT